MKLAGLFAVLCHARFLIKLSRLGRGVGMIGTIYASAPSGSAARGCKSNGNAGLRPGSLRGA